MRALVLLSLLVLGCDDELQVGRGTNPSAAPTGGQAAGGDIADAGISLTQYRDEDFIEAESNRDPFRNQARTFQTVAQPSAALQRDVIMRDTGIDEIRLIAIVTNIADPRAMLIDRNGTGWAVRRGNFVCRAEVVQSGGTDALPVTLNWRVERIRPNEVVLTREDPTAPNQPPLTRVLVLHEESEEQPTPR